MNLTKTYCLVTTVDVVDIRTTQISAFVYILSFFLPHFVVFLCGPPWIWRLIRLYWTVRLCVYTLQLMGFPPFFFLLLLLIFYVYIPYFSFLTPNNWRKKPIKNSAGVNASLQLSMTRFLTRRYYIEYYIQAITCAYTIFFKLVEAIVQTTKVKRWPSIYSSNLQITSADRIVTNGESFKNIKRVLRCCARPGKHKSEDIKNICKIQKESVASWLCLYNEKPLVVIVPLYTYLYSNSRFLPLWSLQEPFFFMWTMTLPTKEWDNVTPITFE